MLPRRTAACLAGAVALVPLSLVPVAAVATTPHNGYLVKSGTEYSTGTTPFDVVTADFDGDGFDDWATANINSNTVTVMLSDGAGGFTAAPGSPITVTGASHLRTGFVDAGTVPDLVVVKNATGVNPDTLATLLGTGDGGFGAPIAGPSLGAEVSTIQVGDVSGDGVLDVISARALVDTTPNPDTYTYPVTVWEGDGSGSFTSLTTVTDGVPSTVYGGPQTIELGDMDGDTDPDIVVPSLATRTVAVWLNNGSGSLAAAVGSPYAVGASVRDLTLADIDTDGDLDALVADPNTPDGSVRILLGNGSGGLTATTPITTSGMPVYFLERTDFNGDGITDLVALSNNYQFGNGRFMTFLGDGTGGFAVGWGTGTYTLSTPNALAAGDFTGDGLADLAITDNSANKVRIYLSVIDDTAPVTTVVLTPPDTPESGWFTTSVNVSWSIEDTGSGWANVRCVEVLDPGYLPASYDALPTSFCINKDLTTDGVHHYWLAGIDRAGNKEIPHETVILIDTTEPDVLPTVEPSTFVTGTEGVAAEANASDTLSGVAASDCDPIDHSVGQHIMECRATDNAGNQGDGQTTYTVLPEPDASVTTASTKAAGTRVALKATVSTNAERDSTTLTFTVPASLRPDSATAGCVIDGLTVSCSLGPLAAGSSRQVTVLASPRSPGPHAWSAAIEGADSDPANDTANGSVGINVVCDNVPTSGADTVVGTSGADILCGLGGNDSFRGLAGNDLIFGGPGVDRISYAGAPGTWVDLRQQGLGVVGAKARSGTGHGQDSFTGIESVLGSSFADLITGNGVVNRLLGGQGNDVLAGLGGADRLEGGAGNDKLTGGAGTDTLIGGSGTDTCRESTDAQVGCER